MISELERIDYELKKNAKNGIGLKEFIYREKKKFEQSNRYKEMKIGDRYFANDSDIQNKTRTYIEVDGSEKVAPHAKNFKLEHSIIYKLVMQKASFLLKQEPTIQQRDEEHKNESYSKEISKVFNKRMHKRLKRTVIEAVNKGINWWYVYIDESGDLKVQLKYATKIIPLWADDEHEVLDGIIMVYKLEQYTDTGKEDVIKIEFCNLEGIRYYVIDGDHLIEDVEEAEKHKKAFLRHDDEGTSIFGHFVLNDVAMVWKKIPYIYWKYNCNELSLIHYLKSLVDCYNELTSRKADNIYEAPDGVNVIKNYSDDEEKFQTNLQTINTIFIEGDGDYDRKKIEIDIEAFKVFIEQLRKDIYEAGFGVDTQSEKFGNQKSGIAIQELYADLDLDCSNIETEFQASLEYFKFFIDNWLFIKTGQDYTDIELDFSFNKTMTVNEQELIENCKNSVGIISNKTIRSKHPFVTDLEKEEKQIAKEEQEANEYAQSFAKLQNKNNNNNSKNNDEGIGNNEE